MEASIGSTISVAMVGVKLSELARSNIVVLSNSIGLVSMGLVVKGGIDSSVTG